MALDFLFYRLRFHFDAIETVLFPPGKSGNVVRGAFGRSFRQVACAADCRDSKSCERVCSYRAIFEPRGEGSGPSGLQDPPRPFVIRAWEFDGRRVEAGDSFWFDLHLFDVRDPKFADYGRAFARFAEDGVGPRQARARLRRVEFLDLEGGATDLPEALTLHFEAGERASKVEVDFLTPTELKAQGEPVLVPEFSVLFARLRDRLSTLRSLYGGGPLRIDFRAMGERAERVMVRSGDWERREVLRRSGRTGQTHSIGGFQGRVEYAGELSEFVPYLLAGRWAGVGRQTVWGKGEIRVFSVTA